jgi:hypothetical protein
MSTIPTGWALLPIEATPEMKSDDRVDCGERTAGKVWSAMAAAAPPPPAELGAIAVLDASWRATLSLERGVHLNEVRLKDEYRGQLMTAVDALRLARAWCMGDGFSGEVTVALRKWIDAGMKGPLPADLKRYLDGSMG